jgi:hypothetical protein
MVVSVRSRRAIFTIECIIAVLTTIEGIVASRTVDISILGWLLILSDQLWLLILSDQLLIAFTSSTVDIGILTDIQVSVRSRRAIFTIEGYSRVNS